MVCLKLAEQFELGAFDYAHRGLWSPAGPTENSLEAFLAAAEQGLGIEFDVRPSRDGVPLIFHDYDLTRMTGVECAFEDFDATDLIGMKLIGGGTIMSLEGLLEKWPTDAPLLCEIKIDGRTAPESFANRVANAFSQYEKPAAIMSFSRRVVSSLPDAIQKGQLVDSSENIGLQQFLDSVQSSGLEHCDYIACNIYDAESIRAELPLCTWTVRNPVMSARLAPFVDSQIFEGFDPALVKKSTRVR